MSTKTQTAVSFSDLDVSKILLKGLEDKKSANEKFSYAHIKLGYKQPNGKIWTLTQACPNGLGSSGVKRVVDDASGKARHTVTLMHNFDDEDDGTIHEQHVEVLNQEYKRMLEIIATGLIAMSSDDKFKFLGLAKWKAKLVKAKTWDIENLARILEEDEIVRPLTFQIEIDDKPIENAERKPAARFSVKVPSDFTNPDYAANLAAKYYFPRKQSETEANRVDIEDMVSMPHTGNYRIRIPYVHIAKGDGLPPKVYIQAFVASCYNMKAREGNSLDEAQNEEAAEFVESDDAYDEANAIFAKKAAERRKKASEAQEAEDPAPAESV